MPRNFSFDPAKNSCEFLTPIYGLYSFGNRLGLSSLSHEAFHQRATKVFGNQRVGMMNASTLRASINDEIIFSSLNPSHNIANTVIDIPWPKRSPISGEPSNRTHDLNPTDSEHKNHYFFNDKKRPILIQFGEKFQRWWSIRRPVFGSFLYDIIVQLISRSFDIVSFPSLHALLSRFDLAASFFTK